MSQKQESNRLPIIVTLFATLIAVVLALKQGSNLTFQDEIDFVGIARNLAQHGFYSLDGISPTAFRQPGWPILLAGLFKVGASLTVCRLLNTLLYGGVIYLSAQLARKWFGDTARIVYPILALLYPILAFTSATLYPQTLAALLLVVSLHYLWREEGGWKSGAFAGLAFGYLCLTVSTFAAFGPILLAIPFLLKSKQKAVTAGAFVVVSALVVAPWLVRNQIVMGKATFSTNMGYNLALGNSKNAGPNTGVNANIDDMWPTPKGTEVENDHYLAGKAIEWAKENPGTAVALYGKKFANFFGYQLGLATEGAEGGQAKNLLIFVTYYPLLALALARFLLFKSAPASKVEWVLAGLYVLFGLISAVFFTRIRFRLPVDYLLIFLATRTVCLLLDRRKAAA